MAVICTGFTKTYPAINLHLKKSDEKGYDYTILLIYLSEIDKGFKVKRINKTSKKGTTVSYKLIKDAEDLQHYKNLIQEGIDGFNSKYRTDIKLEED